MIKEYIEAAQSLGFTACILKTEELCFDFSFRKYCQENLCGNFGSNNMCPPNCKTPEQMKADILMHRYILVLKSEHNVSDFFDYKKIEEGQKKHNLATAKLLEKINIKSGEVALSAPSDLKIGKEFSVHGLSAYCINVKQMAEKCNMNYDFKNNRLALFGFITID